MKIEVDKWKEFKVEDIFTVKYGINMELDSCIQTDANDPEGIAFVARTAENNGVSAYVKPIEGKDPQPAETITVAGGGSVLSTFLQHRPFYSGRDLYLLYTKKDVNINVKLFLCSIISSNKYKFSYGRQANRTLPGLVLELPIKRDKKDSPIIDSEKKYSEVGYIPDWEWMNEYVESLQNKPITTKNYYNKNKLSLDPDKWETFILNEIFELKGGYYNKKPEHSEQGQIPFLGSIDSNNGVTEYYSKEDISKWDKVGTDDNTLDRKIFKKNCIAVTVNGSVCNAYYQGKEFTCSHDITVLYLKDQVLSPCLAVFICTVIMQDKYRWNYGRKPHNIKKFGNSKIKLPIKRNKDGSPVMDKENSYSNEGYIPDWEYMENFIKSLPYGDRITE